MYACYCSGRGLHRSGEAEGGRRALHFGLTAVTLRHLLCCRSGAMERARVTAGGPGYEPAAPGAGFR